MAKLEYKIGEIPKPRALDFIQKYHYSPVMPRITKHFLGFFVEGEVKAVLTLGWGTQPKQTINKLFSGLATKHYYEIGKLCIADEMKKNTGSQILSSTIRWMKQNTDKIFLYTLADGIMGKCGYVYQAANFYYGGSFQTHTYLMPNNEKLHIRSANHLLIQNQIQDYQNKGFRGDGKKRIRLSLDFMNKNGIRVIDGLMFRYIYPLNKTAKSIMKNHSNLLWRQNNYPKEEDLVWMDTTDKENKFQTERPEFSFEKTKYNRLTQTSGATLDKFFT